MISGFEGTTLNAEIEDLVLRRHIGGLVLFGRNFVSIPQLHRLIRDVQRLASTRGSGIPLFISVDQEGGRVSRLKSPFSEFPSQSCLGKAQSEDLAFRFGQALAWELKAVGINMDFAPVLDVNTNPANPIIGNRALSDDPHWTARLGGAVVRGIRETGVLPVGKHFPGHGDTREDSHLELPRVQKDAAALDQTELLPFAHAIQEGLEAVMTAHVVYPAWDAEYPASFSKTILQDILRTKLNFQGLVISDDLEMKAVENHFPLESIPALGLDAGLDLFLICNSVEKTGALFDLMVREIERGRTSSARVEQSLQRILNIKNKLPPPPALPDFGSWQARHQGIVEEMKSRLKL